MFILYYKESGKRGEAYLKAFETNNAKYAYRRAGELLRTERAKKFMDELMVKAMQVKGIDDEYILGEGKKAIEEAKGEKKVPGLHFITEYTGLGEANKQLPPGVSPGGFIGAAEIPITDAEEVSALPEGQREIEEHVEDSPIIHHGDIVDEDVLPRVGKERNTE